MRLLAVATAAALTFLIVEARAQVDIITESPAPSRHTDARVLKRSTKLDSNLSLADVHALSEQAQRALARDDHDAAAALFEAVLESHWFDRLDAQQRSFVVTGAAETASILGDYSRAHALYVRSTGAADAGQDEWMGRLNAAWFIGDHDDAVAALSYIAKRWPGDLDYVSQWAIDALLGHARKTAGTAELEILTAMFDVGWETDLGLEPTHLWMRFIELLVDRGEIDRAVTVSARIRDPLAIVRILADKRFARIVAAAPDWFDVGETLEAAIIEARVAVDANPHLLAPSIRLAEALLRADRPRDALLVLDAQMTRSAMKTVLGEALEDATTESVQALTTRALALIALERWDEAAEQLALAAGQRVPPHRNGDFSAVALLQARLGLPDAALATLQRAAAGPGEPQAELVRFIVAQARHDTAGAEASLQALLSAENGAAAQAQRALLIAGDVDEAAALLISRLNDPQQRGSALLEIQGMREQTWPEAAADWRTHVGSLMSRDDVRRSVAATGATVAEYALYRWN